MLFKRLTTTLLLAVFISVLHPVAFAGKLTERKFTPLFNGTDLTGWEGETKGYTVKNGEIHSKSGVSGNMYTEKEYTDFNFRFEFKLTPGANNGLGLRLFPGAHGAFDAIELQILDNTADKYKKLEAYQYHGSVYGVIPAKRGFLKPLGEWNKQEVISKGNHIKVILNGEVIVDGDVAEASKGGTLDHKDHPGLKRSSGHIGFLGHGDILAFRNIRIKELKTK